MPDGAENLPDIGYETPEMTRQDSGSSEYTDASSDNEEVEERQHWLVENLQRYCGDTPGVFLYIPFAVTLTTVWAVSWRLTTIFELHAEPPDVIVMQQTKFMEGIAAVIFGISLIVQSSGVFFQATPKKRILHSLAVYINLACCSTYGACALDIFPHFETVEGMPTEFFRIFTWANTTTIMILTIAALGASSNKNQLVPDWNLVLRTWMCDWAMLSSGAMQHYLGTTPVGNLFLMFALMCQWRIYVNIGEMTRQSITSCATSHEIASLRGVQWLTYLLWAAFPVIHILQRCGYIDHVEYELSIITIDIVTKNVYSVILLSGNFCVLDMFAIIREHQVNREDGMVQNAVVNVDAVNKALQTAVVEAEASKRLSRSFLANMSHELRTPLNSVIAFSSQLLQAEDIEPLHQDYVKLSVQSAQSLLGIINQVLEYAKLENDEIDKVNAVAKGSSIENKDNIKSPSLLPSLNLTVEPFSLGALCHALYDTLLARSSERRVDFAIIFDELWAPSTNKGWLLGDAKRVRQILVILCDNAIKFSRDDVTDRTANMRISVKTDAAKPTHENLSIKVSDNGCGIEKDKKDLLFKPFSQLSSHYARRHGGTGLALAICKKVVEAMHGTVTCSSEGSNKGTTFTVEMQLPKCAVPPGVVADRHKLKGRVHLILSDGPTLDALGTACGRWGLEVKVNEASRGRNDAVASKTKSVIALLEENFADCQTERPLSTVLILDGSIFMAVMETRPELKNVPNIIVICYQDWGEGVTSEVFEKVGLLLRPVKITSLRSKLDALLRPKGKTGFGSPMSIESGSPQPQMPPASADSSSVDRSVSPVAMRVSSNKSIPDAVPGAPGSRVLVATDQAVAQRVAIAILRKTLGKDAVIDLASDGPEAFEKATRAAADGAGLAYDVIFMDAQMPNKSGPAAVVKLRAWEADRGEGGAHRVVGMGAPVAGAAESEEKECLEAGMDRHVRKPLNVTVVKQLMMDFGVLAMEPAGALSPL